MPFAPRGAAPSGVLPGLAAGLYGGALATLIWRLKYRDRSDLARAAAHLIARQHAGARPDALVPVPLHPNRLATRGYNQAALIALELGALWDVPVWTHVLARVRDTPAQQAAGRRDRRINVAGAFAATGPLPGAARVAIVDDVVTTGATVNACASVF